MTAQVIPSNERVLVTGVSGFTGAYVVAALNDGGYNVVEPPDDFDLASLENCMEVVREAAPDCVIHLAAISFVEHIDATAFYRVNTVGTQNLLEAVAAAALAPRRIVVASSANIYGNIDNGGAPIHEKQRAAPVNHYGASKVAMEHLVRTWADRLPVVLTRPFNYTGIGQLNSFLVPKLVDAFARRQSSISLGNLNVERDYSDVRHIANCYRAMLDATELKHSVYNLCSGVAVSISTILSELSAFTGHHPVIEIDPAFVRRDEIQTLRGDASRINEVLSAQRSTSIPLTDTLRWMLDAK